MQRVKKTGMLINNKQVSIIIIRRSNYAGKRCSKKSRTTGGTAAVAYKIGQNSVKQVEQHTGKSFDNLSEEEIASAIDDLDIDLPAEEQEEPEEAYVEEPDYIDELERLAGLKDKGIITEEEFQAKKKELLGL